MSIRCRLKGFTKISLKIHLEPGSVRRMLNRVKHSAQAARLILLVFALQVVVGGFCVLTPDAHAMSASMQAYEVDDNCDKLAHHESAQQAWQSVASPAVAHQHTVSCSHCGQPDELSSGALHGTTTTIALILVDVAALPVAQSMQHAASGMHALRTPTGPPRSSSLLYTTTQRIRV